METNVIAQLQELLPLLIPILIIQIGLMIFALVDLIRREKTKGPKWVWVLVILLFNIIGPIVYLIVGRDE